MIVFHISGEHEGLAVSEIEALYSAHGTELSVIERVGRLLLAEDGPSPQVLERLAFTHEFYMVDNVTNIKNLNEVLLDLDVNKLPVGRSQGDQKIDELARPTSFCVRCKGFENNALLEREMGEIIYEKSKIPVRLKGPQLTIYLVKLNNIVAISFERRGTDDFQKRNPNDRPFFHPLALNPKLARLMLNLAGLKRGDTVLDPFCGSGSILIEARLMGMGAIGTDRDREMLWGCAQNLGHYGVDARTGEGDATDIKLKNLDAIVTDPPYARASKMFKKGLEDLYASFLESAYDALKPGGRLVFSIPHDATLAYTSIGFEKVGSYTTYVHKSLTRMIYILQKPFN
jgi:tRNA (guanine10-N2)-dimethyltransferase